MVKHSKVSKYYETDCSSSTADENKIPNVSNLVKKLDYNSKISEIENKITGLNHDKYISAPDFNRLTTESFAPRLKQANLVNKTNSKHK